MSRKRDPRYISVQRNAVDLLWTAVDLDDRSMLWLITMLIHHCDDKLGRSPPRENRIGLHGRYED
jgi:hypothetical protein